MVEGGGIAVVTDGAPSLDATATSPPSTDGIVFNPMYSAYIPGSVRSFLVPAVVVDADGGTQVTWSASDPSAVSFGSDSLTGGVSITVHKAGTFTIHAQTSTQSWSAPLTVTSFTDADWVAGNARYNNGGALTDPFADGGQGGSTISRAPRARSNRRTAARDPRA